MIQQSGKIKLRNLISVTAMTLIFLLFQNCSVILPDSDNHSKSQASSGNGEPYSGIHAKSGTYYYVVGDHFICPRSKQPVDGNIAQSITIYESLDRVEYKDHCSSQVIEMPKSALTPSLFSDRFVNLSGSTFQRLSEEELERDQLRRPVARCNFSGTPRREYYAFQSIGSRQYDALVLDATRGQYYFELNPVDEKAASVEIRSTDDKIQISIDKNSASTAGSYDSSVIDSRDSISSQQPSSTDGSSDALSLPCTVDRNPE